MNAPNTEVAFHKQYIPEPNSGCWLWTGYSPNGRYGSLHFNKRRTLAHVVSYTLTYGSVPDGAVVDHLCRNTWCVNPDHLEAVTQLVNTRRSGPATKTHCTHGHPYTDGMEHYYRKDNVGIRYRRCLTCYKIRYPKTRKEGSR